MSDNVTVSWNATYPVRTTEKTNQQVQHVLLDVGGSGAESLVSSSNPLPISTSSFPSSSSATVTQKASSATNITLAASNASRKGLIITNDSTAILYVKFGTTAATTDYSIKMLPSSYFEMPPSIYSGQIDGIWASANGYAYVTEW